MINDFSQGSNLCNLSIRWQIHQSDFVVLFAVCDMHPRNVKIISPQSESPLKSSFNDSMYKAPLKYRRCYSIRLPHQTLLFSLCNVSDFDFLRASGEFTLRMQRHLRFVVESDFIPSICISQSYHFHQSHVHFKSSLNLDSLLNWISSVHVLEGCA